MAMSSRDADIIEELELLAWRYLERANELDDGASASGEKRSVDDGPVRL
jgi:hypothetical protein